MKPLAILVAVARLLLASRGVPGLGRLLPTAANPLRDRELVVQDGARITVVRGAPR